MTVVNRLVVCPGCHEDAADLVVFDAMTRAWNCSVCSRTWRPARDAEGWRRTVAADARRLATIKTSRHWVALGGRGDEEAL
jgi:hypothetical protein